MQKGVVQDGLERALVRCVGVRAIHTCAFEPLQRELAFRRIFAGSSSTRQYKCYLSIRCKHDPKKTACPDAAPQYLVSIDLNVFHVASRV